MQIGITGHSRGIGKCLSDVFEQNNHEVVGFSRVTGYDISKVDVRKEILNQCKDCDIFINNAYDPTGQLELLKEFLNLWKDTDKIIINISSQIINKPISNYNNESSLICGGCENQYCMHCGVLFYKRYKTQLNDYVKNYAGSVRILNVILDLTDTEFYLIPKDWDRSDFIDPIDLANLIFDVVKYSKKFFIKELNINGNFKGRI